MRCLPLTVSASQRSALSGRACGNFASRKQLKGNAVPDVWLAAATIYLGEHLVSFDRSFRKLIGRSQFTLLEAEAG